MAEGKKIDFENMTLRQKSDLVAAAVCFFSLCILVLIRHKNGIRVVNPLHTLPLMFILLAISFFRGGIWVSSFVLISGVASIIQYYIALHEAKQGILWHSRERGVSWLTPLFPADFSQVIIHRFIDPIFCFVVGLLLFTLHLPELGMLIMLAAVSLAMAEQYLYMQSFELWLDQRDMEIEAREETVSSRGGNRSQMGSRLALLVTIPTGVDEGLQAAMRKRQR